MQLILVSAPSSVPERRANTADTYDFVREVPELKVPPKSPVLIVNTRLFEYQRADAHRVLGVTSGYEIEMAGYPYEPPYVEEDGPNHLWNKGIDAFLEARRKAGTPEERAAYDKVAREMLQEINSAVNSAEFLVRELAKYVARETSFETVA